MRSFERSPSLTQVSAASSTNFSVSSPSALVPISALSSLGLTHCCRSKGAVVEVVQVSQVSNQIFARVQRVAAFGTIPTRTEIQDSAALPVDSVVVSSQTAAFAKTNRTYETEILDSLRP